MSMNGTHAGLERLLYEVKKIVVGQDNFLERVLVALLAGGHLLVEGVPGLAKTLTVATLAQAMQAGALTAVLAVARPAALRAVMVSWRQSLGAGLCGAIASVGWFTALAYAPAAPVRAVGMVEMPMAALAGRRMFAERLAPWQWVAGGLTGLGVALAALG